MHNRSSGLTRDDAVLIAEYLNATKTIDEGRYKWIGDTVSLHDSYRLGITSQDPIVCHQAASYYFTQTEQSEKDGILISFFSKKTFRISIFIMTIKHSII